MTARQKTNVTVATFEDKTGYERFINQIHVEDYVANDVGEQTFSFVFSILSWWNGQNFDGTLNSISAFNDDSAVVRFHPKRRNESWLADDLDAHQEGILELPSPDIEFLTSSNGTSKVVDR
jgi:hypothetical protein